MNLNRDVLGFLVFIHHLFVFFIIHELEIGVAIAVVGSGSSGSSSTSSLSSTTDFETEKELKQSDLAGYLNVTRGLRIIRNLAAMIFYQMEFLLGLYLSYLPSYVHLPQHSLHFSQLFFDICEDWGRIERATD